MKHFHKNIIVPTLIILTLFLIAPKITLASVPTYEMNPLVTGSVKSTAASTYAQIGQTVYEWSFKLAAETLKRQLLNMIVDQIVNWIQGGGEPKFITDWPAFFQDAIDQAGGKFIQQIGLSQLCSPFKPLLSAAFIPIPTFSERTSCTLSQVGVNIEDFLQDFRNGGWVAWREMVLKPQNNVYGAYVMAWDQYETERSVAAKAAEAEAQAGRGFLNVKRCIQSHVATDVKTGQNTTICDRYEVVTPGAVVGDLAAKAVGSDIDYIVNADDFAAYASAIVNAVLNRMFAEGVGLLHAGLSSGGGGGGGGSSSQAQCASLLGTAAYSDCVNAIQTGIDIGEFQKNHLQSLINQDLVYQNQLLGAKQATLTVLNQSIDILNQLKDCQGSMTPALGQVQNAASTIVSQIAQIQSDIIALQIKQQEINAVTDILKIPPLFVQVIGVVNPAATQSLVLAAQQETSQKQQAMSVYQQQLNSCQEEQQQEEQQPEGGY